MVGCVTGGVGSGVHRLRNTVGGIVTFTGLRGGRIALRLTRRTLGSVVSPSRGGIVAPSCVVSVITRRFSIAISSLYKGGHGSGVMAPHRVTVCLYERVVSAPLGSVKGYLKGHSRAAVVRNVSGVRGRVGGSRGLGGAVRALGGGVGPRK